MKNSRRFFASALVVFVLLFSIGSQSVAIAARNRCPVRIPDSLLTLYAKSDLIVRGSMAGGKFLKKTVEFDYGYYFDTEINLRVSKTFKGIQTNSMTFIVSEFKSADAADGEENKRDLLNTGEEALFFLVKDDEDGSYALADNVSGVKPLDAVGLDVYAKRIEELNRIAATKKNQLPKLTEWLLQLVENPLTRDEGLLDLNDSFQASDSERENTEDEKTSKEKAGKIKKPFVLDKDFRAANTPEIANFLTDSQKQRLSNEFLNLIGENLLQTNRGDAEEEIYPDYGFMNLVGRWDKNSLAMSSFGFLQSADDSNLRRNVYLMRVIGDFLEDDSLYDIINEYEDMTSKPGNAMVEDIENFKIEELEVATATEGANTQESESATENQVIEKVEEIPVSDQEKKTDEAAEKSAAQITVKEYREKLLAKFSRQYGIVVSQAITSN